MGAPWFDPANLDHTGIGPLDMFDATRGRRVRDLEDLAAIRRETPGDIGVFHFLDETAEDDLAVLDNVLAHPDVAVATDAIPYLREGRPLQGEVWPLPGDALAHPRLAGTFCRVLRRQVRERRVLTLPEAIRRMTLVPAQWSRRPHPTPGARVACNPAATPTWSPSTRTASPKRPPTTTPASPPAACATSWSAASRWSATAGSTPPCCPAARSAATGADTRVSIRRRPVRVDGETPTARRRT
jgi:hypothetical protein